MTYPAEPRTNTLICGGHDKHPPEPEVLSDGPPSDEQGRLPLPGVTRQLGPETNNTMALSVYQTPTPRRHLQYYCILYAGLDGKKILHRG